MMKTILQILTTVGVAVALQITCVACLPESAPEQVHLAYGETPNEMVVMWSARTRATANTTRSECVRYGLADSAMLQQSASCEAWQFTEGNRDGAQFIYRSTLSGLESGQGYFYQVSTDFNITSEIFKFSVPKSHPQAYPLQVVMFGDMGKTDGSPTLPHLISEARSGDNVALIHVGDFAYDLHTDGGLRGDKFMQRLQEAAAFVPYMTCPGNHEIPHNFSHYRNRFTMPTAQKTPRTDELWWSMDIGPVHFVSYDTEVFFVRPHLVAAQLSFLRDDLSRANSPEQRKKVPWIVAFGHRPMYCSNIDLDDCTTSKSVVRARLESLFYEQGVDIIVQGHEHSYERLYPVFNETVTQENYANPRAPVHFISGQAGCNENFAVCSDMTLGPRGPWSAFRSWLPGLYGYGRLRFLNGTHAQWTQIYDITSRSADTVMIVQQHHGPFGRASE